MEHNQQYTGLGRLLLIANLSILMIGLGFAVRTNIAINLQHDIFDKIDLATSTAMLGKALGVTFTGFAFTLLFGSALVDRLGAKLMLLFSAFSYILGSLLIAGSSMMPAGSLAHATVFSGLLLTGLGWGTVEAASNPLVASIDPQNKIHRLNVLHAWWPAGIVIGGISGVLIAHLGISWQFNLGLLIIPGGVLAYLVATSHFPPTERVTSGVSYLEMFKELFKQPLFYVFWACMWLTAITELAPGQWVDLTLTQVVGMKGIWVLVYVSMLMFIMRHFAGALAKRISGVGILLCSSVVAAIGLYLLSQANSPVTAFLAATVWGIGVCYMWPTMLANVSERFPRGGALFLGLMGFAGGMAIQFTLPMMGQIFDQAKINAAGGVEKLALLQGSELEAVLRLASIESFSSVAIVPVLLIPVFGLIWLFDKKNNDKSTISSHSKAHELK
ncbi:hypothetical protein TDB9533_01961 [Thalassocella blandensis]|nr:hypothetical protein TDB9533_01961 [Thalassocella blandensis]